jgi:hypothetical protein
MTTLTKNIPWRIPAAACFETEFIFGGSCLILLVLFRTWSYITGLDEP